MWNRRTAVPGLTLCAVALVGACADGPPTQPSAEPAEISALFGGAPQDPSSFGGTLDAHFVRMTRDIPGFGGAYFDDAGALNVVMAPVMRPMAEAEVQNRLAVHLTTMGRDPAAARGAVIRPGQYDFAQLDAMHMRAMNVLSLQGTVFTDADERRNRVVVGVEDDAAAASVERALAMMGVPREAVIIERALPVVPEQTLRQHVRPVAGGLQINFGGSLCTHGFNVRPGHPAAQHIHGFVTNSHCSAARSQVTRTPYWQPTGSPDTLHVNFIGREEHDLPFFTGGICPPGRRCRWSDSLGARYAPGVDNAFGAIYRTLFHGPTGLTPGSLDIDPANPRWQIVGELPFPMVGDSLHKTGRTNGWTTGPVNTTCQNTNTSPDLTMLCQERIFTWSSGGDSGSPYYQRIGQTNQVRLAGLHWGSDGQGNTVMSAISNIRHENVHPHGWITFPGQTPPPPPPPR